MCITAPHAAADFYLKERKTAKKEIPPANTGKKTANFKGLKQQAGSVKKEYECLSMHI